MSDEVYIDCMYSCTLCGIKKAHVQVQARAEEDVVDWLTQIATPALVADHRKRSPHCHPNELAEVYIPLTGTNKIGGPCVQ